MLTWKYISSECQSTIVTPASKGTESPQSDFHRERPTMSTMVCLLWSPFFPTDTVLFLCLSLAFDPCYSHMFLPFLSLFLSLPQFILFQLLFPNLRALMLLFPPPHDRFFP